MAYTYVKLKPIRNTTCTPDLSAEGVFLKRLPQPVDYKPHKDWWENLTPYERMFYHQTLNSARRFACFVPSRQIPTDSLDFVMASRFNQSLDMFGEKTDAVFQRETADETTFRRLRNTSDQEPLRIENLGHPLRIGGQDKKISPHSVKLINSGHHSQLTNPGYSRQPADGNKFNY